MTSVQEITIDPIPGSHTLFRFRGRLANLTAVLPPGTASFQIDPLVIDAALRFNGTLTTAAMPLPAVPPPAPPPAPPPPPGNDNETHNGSNPDVRGGTGEAAAGGAAAAAPAANAELTDAEKANIVEIEYASALIPNSKISAAAVRADQQVGALRLITDVLTGSEILKIPFFSQYQTYKIYVNNPSVIQAFEIAGSNHVYVIHQRVLYTTDNAEVAPYVLFRPHAFYITDPPVELNIFGTLSIYNFVTSNTITVRCNISYHDGIFSPRAPIIYLNEAGLALQDGINKYYVRFTPFLPETRTFEGIFFLEKTELTPEQNALVLTANEDEDRFNEMLPALIANLPELQSITDVRGEPGAAAPPPILDPLGGFEIHTRRRTRKHSRHH